MTAPSPGGPLPAVAPAALGGLGPPLLRLAAVQGAWPPRRPTRVVPAATAGSTAGGEAAADALVDEGADLVVAREAGPPGPALALLAVLLDLEPVAAVGTTPSPGWAELVAEVRDLLRAGRSVYGDDDALLAALGAGEVAGLTGLLERCAARRTPVLLSGAPGVLAAALLADRRRVGTRDALLAGCSPAPGGPALVLGELRLTPLLDLHLSRPEGADLALALLLGGLDLAVEPARPDLVEGGPAVPDPVPPGA